MRNLDTGIIIAAKFVKSLIVACAGELSGALAGARDVILLLFAVIIKANAQHVIVK